MDSINKKTEEAEPWAAPLKVPVTEIIDLSSESDEPNPHLDLKQDQETRDASGVDDGVFDDDQWSMYEDILNTDEPSDEYFGQQGKISSLHY